MAIHHGGCGEFRDVLVLLMLESRDRSPVVQGFSFCWIRFYCKYFNLEFVILYVLYSFCWMNNNNRNKINIVMVRIIPLGGTMLAVYFLCGNISNILWRAWLAEKELLMELYMLGMYGQIRNRIIWSPSSHTNFSASQCPQMIKVWPIGPYHGTVHMVGRLDTMYCQSTSQVIAQAV